MYELDLSKVITVEECRILAKALKSGLVFEGKQIYIDEKNEMYELGYQSAMDKMEQIKADYKLLRSGKKPKRKIKNG